MGTAKGTAMIIVGIGIVGHYSSYFFKLDRHNLLDECNNYTYCHYNIPSWFVIDDKWRAITKKGEEGENVIWIRNPF